MLGSMLIEVYFTLMDRPQASPSLKEELHHVVSSSTVAKHLQKSAVYQLISDYCLDATEIEFFATYFQDWDKMVSTLISSKKVSEAIEFVHSKVRMSRVSFSFHDSYGP